MKKSFYSFLAFAAVSFLAVSALDAAEKGNLVADPTSAVKNTWKKYPVSGKDFWMLLDPRWLELKGVAQEEFVQKSGTGFVHQSVAGENVVNLRVMTIGEITSYDAKNRRMRARFFISLGSNMPVVSVFAPNVSSASTSPKFLI